MHTLTTQSILLEGGEVLPVVVEVEAEIMLLGARGAPGCLNVRGIKANHNSTSWQGFTYMTVCTWPIPYREFNSQRQDFQT